MTKDRYSGLMYAIHMADTGTGMESTGESCLHFSWFHAQFLGADICRGWFDEAALGSYFRWCKASFTIELLYGCEYIISGVGGYG